MADTRYKKGQSGNPKGRPPKVRAWAELIRTKGQKKIELADGRTVDAQDLIAELTIEGLITGKITFPRRKGERGRALTLRLEGRDWVKFLKETREHLEPPARQELDVTSDGEKIDVTIPIHVYIPDNKRQ